MTHKVISFHHSHFEKMDLRELDRIDLYHENTVLERYQFLSELPNNFTFIHQDKVICCGGIIELWAGVGEGWMVGSEHIDKFPIAFFKVMNNKLMDVVLDRGLRRVQVTCNAKFHRSMAWLEKIGFKQEGLLKEYGVNGDDHYYYARLLK